MTMAITFDTKAKYGEMTIHDGNGTETIQIVGGNCLAVMIYEFEDKYCLYAFLLDSKHGKKWMKYSKDHTLFGKWGEEVVRIRLNMAYKECKTLLDLFMKSGYEVECYYKKEE